MYISFWLPFFHISPGLVCMKSSSSVVELVMLLCSQASLASISFLTPVLRFSTDLIYQAHPECSKSTAQSGQWAIQRLIFPPRYFVYLFHIHPVREWGWEKASLAANIGLRVKGGRPVRATFDPSAGPCGLAKLMRRDNVDLMVLCIDYPSLLCCLVGVLLPSLFSCCRIHEY